MKTVKIIGAGSIGNHLANASRSLGWDVALCDVDPAALERTRDDIYPGRYGAWDPAIQLFKVADAPKGGFDMICIGTPPDHHVGPALDALDENPAALLVEKPLATPDLSGVGELEAKALAAGVPVFVGYDHVVGPAARAATALLDEGLGPALTIDVEFREHWRGIFAAHPWLAGPHETYLGHWRRGGGASGEHSHAVNLWQHLAVAAGAGRVAEVSAALDYVEENGAAYDRLAAITLKTENGLIGRVVQDVITDPPRKWARVQCADGFVEWRCGWTPGVDAIHGSVGGEALDRDFPKTRPDDFIAELRHIDAAVSQGRAESSPIALARGADTMRVLAACHRSAAEGRAVVIDYGEEG